MSTLVAWQVHTYTAVLKGCAMAGQWRSAQSMLRRMQQSGLEPTAFHFGCVIDACSRGGEIGKVRWLD